jgi:hypothetical protein
VVRKFLLGLALFLCGQAHAQQPANPPLVTAPWSNLNPDIMAVVATDPAAGASLVTYNGPIPAPTSDFVLRVASRFGGQTDYHAIVKHETTWASLALDHCMQINSDPVQKAADVACQLNNPSISTFLGVTHHADNPLVVTAMTGAPLMLVQNGSPALDAGPTIVAKRVPPGIVPRPARS